MNEAPHFRLDRRAVLRSFSRASRSYDAAAQLQASVNDELLERLQYFQLEPRVILDLGCGTGRGAAALRARFARARVIAVDSALAMTQQARRRQRFWRRYECVCADACALPFAAQSADLVFSNLMLQWCDDPLALFTQVQRALRPGGLFLFTTFGPDTLHELRSAWASADDHSHVSAFADMPQLGAAMAQAGLVEPVMDREIHCRHYPDVHALVTELRRIGARHAAADRRASLTGPARARAMLAAYGRLRTAEGIPASWEIIYGAAFAGERRPGLRAGASGAAAAETLVPLSAVRAGARR
jgi:malonyl-CoA O-methyltransferase